MTATTTPQAILNIDSRTKTKVKKNCINNQTIKIGDCTFIYMHTYTHIYTRKEQQ